MSPFPPKGDRSLRVIVAELAARADYDTLLSFEELARAIGVDPGTEDGLGRVRATVAAARPSVLKDFGRALVSVRSQGYRVAKPGELAGIAQGHRDRADVQVGKALSIINNGRTDNMTEQELVRFRAVGTVLTRLHSRMTEQDSRIADLEAAVFGRQPTTIPGQVMQEGSTEQTVA